MNKKNDLILFKGNTLLEKNENKAYESKSSDSKNVEMKNEQNN